MKTKFRLKCGTMVIIEEIQISQTYGEVIGGDNIDSNIYLYDKLSAPKNWGERKTVFNKKDFDIYKNKINLIKIFIVAILPSV